MKHKKYSQCGQWLYAEDVRAAGNGCVLNRSLRNGAECQTVKARVEWFVGGVQLSNRALLLLSRKCNPNREG